MKRIYTLLFCALFSISLLAQAPQKISYQSVIRSSNNTLLTNTAVGMKISILQGSASGTIVYEETHNPTTNTNGLVSIGIGGGTAITGTFSTIDWSLGSYFVKTETDPAGGVNYTLTGTSELLSVPFALYAKTAGSGSGMPSGTTNGEMLYYKDGQWVSIPPGTRGQNLTYCDGNIPTWGPCPVNLPVVLTLSHIDNGTVMTVNANVLSDGGADITYRGVIFTTNGSSTISVGQSGDEVSGNSTGAYSKTYDFYNDVKDKLDQNFTLYATPYAINSKGIAYGETITYTPQFKKEGEFHQGGIIGYLDNTLEHGLIVAPTDQSVGTYWNSGVNNFNGATGTAIGTGESNTAMIMFNQGNSALAAKMCYDLELGGYSDWFLPSATELGWTIVHIKNTVTTTLNEGEIYWSSSEEDSISANALSFFCLFECGYIVTPHEKNNIGRVRAVRKF